MKWDRSKKNKFPSIEIEMSNTNYKSVVEKTADEETSIPLFQVWPNKHNSNSPSPTRKEHSFILQSGDSGIESVQVRFNFRLPFNIKNV